MSLSRWRRLALSLGGLLALELGARITLPGINTHALANFLRTGGRNLLLSLYDTLGGGGLSRGAVLALGIAPYISATIMVRLARLNDRRWTRLITLGLATIQSYGFTRFVQKIPGVVTDPGPAFFARTMLVLTGGSIIAMLVGEQLTHHEEDDDAPPHDPTRASLNAPVPDLSPAKPRSTAKAFERR